MNTQTALIVDHDEALAVVFRANVGNGARVLTELSCSRQVEDVIAGVLLATPRDGGRLRVGNDDRHAVHDGSLSMVELCRRDDLVLDLSTTHYVDHWITPVGEARRFDTRFFLTEVPDGQEPLHDDKETVESLWIRPAEALRMQAAGELMMMPPTMANLRFLEPHPDAASALAAAALVENPPCVLPRIRRDADGRITGVAMPGDADYADLVDEDRVAINLIEDSPGLFIRAVVQAAGQTPVAPRAMGQQVVMEAAHIPTDRSGKAVIGKIEGLGDQRALKRDVFGPA